MQIKKVLKVVLLCCLTVILAVSVFGCKGKEGPNKYNLPNQYQNIIYYFEQGFHEGWSLVGDESGKYSIPEEKLVIEIKKDEDPNSARYAVYKQKEHDDMPMTSSLRSMFALTVNPEHDLYFNKNMGVREGYTITSADPIDFILNGNQYYSATYTFTKDGAEWQGQYFLLPHGRQFYVVCYESTVATWATYEPIFKEMMNDFRPIGFESEQGVS
ncbi:MAG: hypothetical protein E7388_04125 [Ruminococcaceae bacterium]|nr:hypothetical protein [Oscillospiraceae bacterium]